MMFWYDHDVSGWGWFAMSAGMILLWALIITVALLFFRALNQPQAHTHAPATPSAEGILRERLARGEIDEDDYGRRLNALHTGPLTKP
ncbi:SHOCT domain-containing protein [Streptomyces sp. NPDC006446]|uniref:SHOCT domain-containing protein n=1 Tax=Streptomyces sp. NPDC006446 TaxID=3154301 RepID=UPI0033A6A17D